jgi:hypothetical protein
MNAYIRTNNLEDNSSTYDVVVSGNFEFIYKVRSKLEAFKDYCYEDVENMTLEYSSPCNLREAESLLDSVKTVAVKIVNNWQ